MKTFERNVWRVENISWRRPGILEVSVSCMIGAGDAIPDMPSLPISGVSDLLLIEKRIEGIPAQKVTRVYRKGKKLPAEAKNNSDDGTFWSMDVSLMQVPITSHPNLKNIMAAGAGTLKNGEGEWPRYVNKAKNPWYGTSSFLSPGIVVTKEEIDESSGSEEISFPQIDGVGYATPLDSGAFSDDSASPGPGRSKWLLEAHTVHKVGKEKKTIKTWRHGGALGWANQMYQKGFFS